MLRAQAHNRASRRFGTCARRVASRFPKRDESEHDSFGAGRLDIIRSPRHIVAGPTGSSNRVIAVIGVSHDSRLAMEGSTRRATSGPTSPCLNDNGIHQSQRWRRGSVLTDFGTIITAEPGT